MAEMQGAGSEAKVAAGGLTRRDFALVLGAGVVIAGFVAAAGPGGLLDGLARVTGASGATPRLRDGVETGSADGLLTLSVAAGAAPVCGVNAVGEAVVRRMDGRSTIAEISAALASETGLTVDDALRAQVAFFVAELGALGLLAEPFRAVIYDRPAG